MKNVNTQHYATQVYHSAFFSFRAPWSAVWSPGDKIMCLLIQLTMDFPPITTLF